MHSEVIIGIICFSVANFLFLFCDYIGTRYVLLETIKMANWQIFSAVFLVLMNAMVGYSLFTLWKCCLSDPGYVPLDLHKEVYDKTCNKCKAGWKPPRAYHCKVCARCVFKMDHHCVWVNNCVGVGNAKYFVQFVGSAFFSVMLMTICPVLGALNWMGFLGTPLLALHGITDWQVAAIIANVMIFLFGLIFMYFTYDFFDDFMYGIDRNQTTVENYKMIFGVRFDKLYLRQMYFGRTYWDWIKPTNPKRTHNYLELSYTTDELRSDAEEYELDTIMRHSEYANQYVYK